MGKKNRRKNKQRQHNSQTPHWYDYNYDDYLTLDSLLIFSKVTPKEIHTVAEKIFGQTYYISYEDFQKETNRDIILGHEKNYIQ